MGAIEDVRKVIQHLVAPKLKSLKEQIKGIDERSKLRDEALSAKIDSKFDLLVAKIETNHQAMIFALNIDKRVEAIERKVADPVHAS